MDFTKKVIEVRELLRAESLRYPAERFIAAEVGDGPTHSDFIQAVVNDFTRKDDVPGGPLVVDSDLDLWFAVQSDGDLFLAWRRLGKTAGE